MISKYSGVFFYCRIKKLRQQACYDVPEHNLKKEYRYDSRKTRGCLCKCVTGSNRKYFLSSEKDDICRAPLVFQYKDARITLQDGFNEQTLLKLLNYQPCY